MRPSSCSLSGDVTRGRRALGVAVVTATAALVSAALPGLAGVAGAVPTVPSAHQSHHHSSHLKRIAIDGIVTSVHHRHVTVFASSSQVGRRTAHNTTVHVVLGHHAQRSPLHPGYVLHVATAGRGSTTHLLIPTLHAADVAPAPASVIVGTVSDVVPGGVVVAQFSRDDGDHGDGRSSHKLSVDTGTAKVTVDGAYGGSLHRGDFVAILGEADGDNVLASRVYALSDVAETLRGSVVAVNDDKVAIRSYAGKTTVSLGSGDSQVPMFLNGALASTSALGEGDRIVVLGIVTEEEDGFVPLIAFAFNGHDNGPCGEN
jgi:hypothetical protein